MRMLFSMLLVGAGGFVGSVLRYALALMAQRYSISFPHGTLWVNLLGCLAIGAISALAAATEVMSPAVRLLLATGICGGFTTMSSFIYELAQLLRDSELFLAVLYFGLTLGGCLLMFWIGAFAVKLLLKV